MEEHLSTVTLPALFFLTNSGTLKLHIKMGQPDAQYTKYINLELNKNYSISLIQRNGVFYAEINGSDIRKVKNKNGSKI